MKVLPQIKSNVEYKRPCVETKTRTQLTHRKAYLCRYRESHGKENSETVKSFLG